MASTRDSNFLEILARARAHVNRGNPEPTQSRRTPNRDTLFNDADCIERQMREDGHIKWGWVIYRCTYDSDEQWRAFLERFGYYVNETLVFHNGLDLQASLDLQVHEERELFVDATPEDIRQYFKMWVDGVSEEEDGLTISEREQNGAPAGRSQRYRYCLHVDQDAVESVLAGPEPPEDSLGGGYVNLVYLPPGYVGPGWPDEAEEAPEATDADENREDGEPRLDPLYMRISYSSLMITWYNLFRGDHVWDTEYRAPPAIGRA